VSLNDFARWQRDRPLLAIAGKIRAARTEATWRAVDEGSPGPGNPSRPA